MLCAIERGRDQTELNLDQSNSHPFLPSFLFRITPFQDLTSSFSMNAQAGPSTVTMDKEDKEAPKKRTR